VGNITLIGMPGSGKSTLGVLFAKATRRDFFDTDLIIQKREGKFLQDIVNSSSADEFIKIERDAIMSLGNINNAVIATGGSAVYSKEAMAYLKGISTVVYLKLSFPNVRRRIRNIKTRGILLKEGQTLKSLYDERVPLYEGYADFTLECDLKGVEDVVLELTKIDSKIRDRGR